MVGPGLSTGTVLGSVLIAILFAYEGWINVTPIVGEMKNPGKDFPNHSQHCCPGLLMV